ncbi:RnfABCDGE type electron transport complex subunit D [Serpentinicella alkaliphila]|uniref:Ion-translocating oxidoreductase complex subunit D n=1 Tax=Serpentinicella alkaliphila TaxID=1734049 RepID=A0A4R2TX21_9FIRM|nr:RnfABCDGE type electron transport complex subunit D [Serpentinicella alkaliphila]QUH26048.1 RnfABCDGE type electron transport complex subunit D [Serpentinicella alkaliphila]TCP99742.1 electron transport complex protein RnfD [Serpentinicella alkaliphila]
MESKLIVTSSPHFRDDSTVQKIMLDVIIALLPATVAGIYFFGASAAMVLALAVLTAVATEAVVQKLMGKPVTINDYSAALTGLLLGLNLAPSVPWWIPVIGSVFAIAIVKQVFGGLGRNFMNPALAARIMLTISWTGNMTDWRAPGVDALSTATPLSFVKNLTSVPAGAPSLMNAFFGSIGGSLGETSAILLILGGIYLVYRGIISPKVPLIYVGTVAAIMLVYSGFDFYFMAYHVFSGGLMIGSIYMATDYASGSITPKGRIIFAFGCGLITSLIRIFGAYPEGVGFSILLMNVAAPLIDRYTSPRVFGEVK